MLGRFAAVIVCGFVTDAGEFDGGHVDPLESKMVEFNVGTRHAG